MKNVLFTLLSFLFLTNTNIHAETYICEVLGEDITLTFGKLYDMDNEQNWDRVAKFKLSLTRTGLPFTGYEETGVVKEGDVYFHYKSDSSEIEFNMYLDENEVTRFTFKGEEMKFTNCEWYEFDQQ